MPTVARALTPIHSMAAIELSVGLLGFTACATVRTAPVLTVARWSGRGPPELQAASKTDR